LEFGSSFVDLKVVSFVAFDTFVFVETFAVVVFVAFVIEFVVAFVAPSLRLELNFN
jgi:hypothetical protein